MGRVKPGVTLGFHPWVPNPENPWVLGLTHGFDLSGEVFFAEV